MSELIVAGFKDEHTAFLASAGLARLQKEIALSGYNVVVVTHVKCGEIAIREAVDLHAQGALYKTFWNTLVGLLFLPLSTTSADDAKASLDRLSRIGIDNRFVDAIGKLVPPGTSALLVLASGETRDQVSGMLQGFGAKPIRIRLIGEDRKKWMERLSAGPGGAASSQEYKNADEQQKETL